LFVFTTFLTPLSVDLIMTETIHLKTVNFFKKKD
jgi:hypothetical protein